MHRVTWISKGRKSRQVHFVVGLRSRDHD
jgi:hypothetical protein